VRWVLHLLLDTSTWLDLGKRRGGQKWVLALRQLVEWEQLELLVPALVVDEYERNRSRVEASMTASVAERFRLLKADFADYGSDDDAAEALSRLAFQTPLIGAMATRNFDDIAALLVQGAGLRRPLLRAKQSCSARSTSTHRSTEPRTAWPMRC